MSQVTCVKIKLKPGSLHRVRQWVTTLNQKRDEALETIRLEGVLVESVFLDQTKDGDYLIYYVRAKDLDQSHKVASQLIHPIMEYHRNFKKETWDERKRLECLIDFESL